MWRLREAVLLMVVLKDSSSFLFVSRWPKLQSFAA